MINPEERLKTFQAENNIFTKGPLSLVVQFTRLVQDKQFPLNPDDFQTSSKGQVAGLGGGNLKKILKEHSITQLKIYFSDFFDVDEDIIESYGAVNISLINDMPLFVDPFLLFNSEKPEY